MVVWQSSHLFTHWPWEEKLTSNCTCDTNFLKRIMAQRTTRMLITCGLWWVVVATYSTGSIIYRLKWILSDCHLYLFVHNVQWNNNKAILETILTKYPSNQEVAFFGNPFPLRLPNTLEYTPRFFAQSLIKRKVSRNLPGLFVWRAPSMSFWRFCFQKKTGPIERLSMKYWCVFVIKIWDLYIMVYDKCSPHSWVGFHPRKKTIHKHRPLFSLLMWGKSRIGWWSCVFLIFLLVVVVYRPSEPSKSSNLWDDVVFVRFRSGDKVMSLGGSGVDGTNCRKFMAYDVPIETWSIGGDGFMWDFCSDSLTTWILLKLDCFPESSDYAIIEEESRTLPIKRYGEIWYKMPNKEICANQKHVLY